VIFISFFSLGLLAKIVVAEKFGCCFTGFASGSVVGQILFKNGGYIYLFFR